MDYDPSGLFITPIPELKLNEDILFKLQRQSHEPRKVPHYQDMFDFLHLSALSHESWKVPHYQAMFDFLDLRELFTESIEHKVEHKSNLAQHRASYITSMDNTWVACKCQASLIYMPNI